MGILNLPNELLPSIANFLPIEGLTNLFLTYSKSPSPLSTHYLYNRLLGGKDDPTPLHWAAEHGHVPLAKLALSRGVEIDSERGNRSRTPLHLAAYSNHPAIIRILFKRGARIDGQDADLMTPLYLAASQGAVEATRTLLELGAGLDHWKSWVIHPVCFVASMGNVDCMKAFIDAGFDINTKDFGGRTILHHAFFGWVKNLDMLKYLLAQEGARAVINVPSPDGRTALHSAADGFGAEHIELLLQQGADMQLKDKEGFTPAHIAAYNGNVECVEAFIKAGSDFNTKGRFGRTMLHEGVLGNVAMVEYLLGQEGAEMVINDKDSQGLTPLHLAVGSCFGAEKARLLLRHGVDMEVKGSDGDTPVHRASYKGDVECMRIFIDAGFDINTRGRFHRTILHHAATRGNTEMAKYLVRQSGGRTSINAQDYWGKTPLHLAAMNNNCDIEMMRLLVQYGADPQMKDSKGETPTHIYTKRHPIRC